jgi:hypothetical protein
MLLLLDGNVVLVAFGCMIVYTVPIEPSYRDGTSAFWCWYFGGQVCRK